MIELIKKIFAGVFSVIGNKRKINQDNFYINGKILKDINKETYKYNTWSHEEIYAVCDGMGGENDGEVASRIAVEEIKNISQNKKLDDSVIHSAIDKANRKICQYISEHGENCGSTFVAVVIKNDEATIYNIGDSRCYLIRNNKITQLTKDHTLTAQMVDAGMLTYEQAEKDKRRHSLVQHLGIFPEEMTLSTYKNSFKTEIGDILIICSDGLTDKLDNKGIIEIVKENENIADLPYELVQSAIDIGSTDNITAMVLKIQKDKEEGLIRILYVIICVCAGLLGALCALISLILFFNK